MPNWSLLGNRPYVQLRLHRGRPCDRDCLNRALELAIDYGRHRSAFGRTLASHQVWQHRFAEMRTQVEAARCLVYRATDLVNRGLQAEREVTMAKLFTTGLAQRVISDRMQIFGAGTSEIMKEILAKYEHF